VAAVFLIAPGSSWRKSTLSGQNMKKNDIAQYLAILMRSWKLFGCVCHAKTAVEKCHHKILYCEM